MQTSKVNVGDYTFQVACSAEDRQHLATCTEFPFLSCLSDTSESALSGLQGMIAEVVEDLEAGGEPVPEPLAHRNYHREFTRRLQAELHKALATEAALEKLMLDQLVVRRLARRKPGPGVTTNRARRPPL